MTGFEDIVWRTWVSPAAPHVARLGEPLRTKLAREAADHVVALFASRESLMEALTSALRRAVTTGLVHLETDGPRLDTRQAHRAALDLDHEYRRILEVEGEIDAALEQMCAAIPVFGGHGADIAREALAALTTQVQGDVLPRFGDGAPGAWQAWLEGALVHLEGDALAAARRDLGGLLSLQGRHGPARALFAAAGDDTRVLLSDADDALDRGDVQTALRHALACAVLCARDDDAQAHAAALRRQAVAHELLGDAEAREHALRLALDEARRAQDARGVAEALEELSRLFADRGEIDHALALLDDLRQAERARAYLPGELRSLQLAGRLLCEGGRPADGLIMLLLAHSWLDLSDPNLAHTLQSYIVGFQYTLSDAEFAELEPLLDLDDKLAYVDLVFATARSRAEPSKRPARTPMG